MWKLLQVKQWLEIRAKGKVCTNNIEHSLLGDLGRLINNPSHGGKKSGNKTHKVRSILESHHRDAKKSTQQARVHRGACSWHGHLYFFTQMKSHCTCSLLWTFSHTRIHRSTPLFLMSVTLLYSCVTSVYIAGSIVN